VGAGQHLTLGGSLVLTFLNGYTAAPGTTFNFFQTGGTISGTFANVTLPTLNSNLTWNLSQLAVTGTISATAINYNQWTALVNLSGNDALPAAEPFGGSPANVLRYAMNLGTAPTPASVPTVSQTCISNLNYLTLQYQARKDLTDYQLVPQSSTDLVNWTNVDAGNITQLTDVDAYTAQYQAAVVMPANGTVFLRVAAQPLP
jgi:hypothetical protein